MGRGESGMQSRAHSVKAAVHFELILLGQHDHVALPQITGDLHCYKYAPPLGS